MSTRDQRFTNYYKRNYNQPTCGGNQKLINRVILDSQTLLPNATQSVSFNVSLRKPLVLTEDTDVFITRFRINRVNACQALYNSGNQPSLPRDFVLHIAELDSYVSNYTTVPESDNKFIMPNLAEVTTPGDFREPAIFSGELYYCTLPAMTLTWFSVYVSSIDSDVILTRNPFRKRCIIELTFRSRLS